MKHAIPILFLIALPALGIFAARDSIFAAFAHSHNAHAARKADVHSAAAEHAKSVAGALGRKGGADINEDWHAPQPPAFSSDEENEEHFDEADAYALTVDHNVHAFYYPWYGTPDVDGKWSHWNHLRLPHWNEEVASGYRKDAHVPPDDIGSDFYPQAGPYSSRDPHVLAHHMKQLRMAGVGTIVASWFPPGKHDDNGEPLDVVWPALLAAADDAGITMAPHLEPYRNRTADTVAEDVKTFLKAHKSSPALYRWDDHRPVVYVYDSYQIEAAAWAQVLSPSGAKTIRKTENDAFVIGLVLDKPGVQSIVAGGFDGAYTYFASTTASHMANPVNWVPVSEALKAAKVAFIPSVGPGYSDLSVRPWNLAATQEREGGKYYDREWDAAMRAEPDVISITSWNEWHEGTQIEPAVPKEAAGRKYLDYEKLRPDAYLRRTRVWAMRFKNDRSRRKHAAREALLPRKLLGAVRGAV